MLIALFVCLYIIIAYDCLVHELSLGLRFGRLFSLALLSSLLGLRFILYFCCIVTTRIRFGLLTNLILNSGLQSRYYIRSRDLILWTFLMRVFAERVEIHVDCSWCVIDNTALANTYWRFLSFTWDVIVSMFTRIKTLDLVSLAVRILLWEVSN